MSLRSLATALAALTLATAAPADMLKFNNNASTIEFTGTKKDGMHSGGFRKFTGTIDAPSGDFGKGKVTVEIRTDSLTSDNDKLTAHLKSPDFFDVRKYPTATFTSTGIKSIRDDAGITHLLTGDLTLLGTKKSLTIPVRVARTATGLKLDATFTLNRKDFGMTYGQGQVNNDVTVKLMVQAGK
jgi:polyisoprenoid-binding protein YceI